MKGKSRRETLSKRLEKIPRPNGHFFFTRIKTGVQIDFYYFKIHNLNLSHIVVISVLGFSLRTIAKGMELSTPERYLQYRFLPSAC